MEARSRYNRSRPDEIGRNAGMNETLPLIYDLDFESLAKTFAGWREPAYRARQVWQGIYQNFWQSPQDFTNLPGKLRQRLSEEFRFSNLNPLSVLQSSDGETRKTLFELPDKRAIEAVLMRYSNRRTLCISTQAGCAMGCVFCATGQMGFRRNLTSGEIIEQVLFYARELHALGERVTNVVVMGMGEPFHNYDATMQAIDRMNHPEGFNFGARRFTISTVGLVPAIRRFAEERRQVNLAVSLHAANDDLRSSMLPVNRKYPLDVLLRACREYIEITHRRITFEWALIQGVNDTLDQARELSGRLEGMLCHVNVIPLNPTKRYSGQASTQKQAHIFKDELEKNGIPCTIRLRRGIDIQAGCGQLAIQQVQSD
jgi:23S rRNA (adenine2503-C2)-methyltransferase